MSSQRSPIRVLYIAGAGRNGSTILDNILGQHPDLFSVGELSQIWDRGLRQGRLCGCGLPVPDCPTWNSILDRAFEGSSPDLVADTIRLLAPVNRTQHILRGHGGRPNTELQSRLAALYQAIATETGARVIVDSSKTPAYAQLLTATPGLDVRIIHLVRDPRAVAYSWQRGKMQIDEGFARPMAAASPSAVAAGWTLWNLLFERMRRRRPATIRLQRYEDLVAAPRTSALELVTFADPATRLDALPFRDEKTVMLEPTHSVSGNPSRFRNGEVTIDADQRWRSGLSAADRRLVTALTWPLAKRYGY